MTHMLDEKIPPLQPILAATPTATIELTHTPPPTSTSVPTPIYPPSEDQPLPAGRLLLLGAMLVLCMGVVGAAIVVIGVVIRANRSK